MPQSTEERIYLAYKDLRKARTAAERRADKNSKHDICLRLAHQFGRPVREIKDIVSTEQRKAEDARQ